MSQPMLSMFVSHLRVQNALFAFGESIKSQRAIPPTGTSRVKMRAQYISLLQCLSFTQSIPLHLPRIEFACMVSNEGLRRVVLTPKDFYQLSTQADLIHHLSRSQGENYRGRHSSILTLRFLMTLATPQLNFE